MIRRAMGEGAPFEQKHALVLFPFSLRSSNKCRFQSRFVVASSSLPILILHLLVYTIVLTFAQITARRLLANLKSHQNPEHLLASTSQPRCSFRKLKVDPSLSDRVTRSSRQHSVCSSSVTCGDGMTHEGARHKTAFLCIVAVTYLTPPMPRTPARCTISSYMQSPGPCLAGIHSTHDAVKPPVGEQVNAPGESSSGQLQAPLATPIASEQKPVDLRGSLAQSAHSRGSFADTVTSISTDLRSEPSLVIRKRRPKREPLDGEQSEKELVILSGML